MPYPALPAAVIRDEKGWPGIWGVMYDDKAPGVAAVGPLPVVGVWLGLTSRPRTLRSDIWRRWVTGGMRAKVAGRRLTSCFMSLSSSSSWFSTGQWTYSGQLYTGQSYCGQLHIGQSHSCQSHTGQSHGGQLHNGQSQ